MIGKEIIVRRKRMSLTQRELARLIIVISTTMYQYEVGLRKIPLEALGNIATILHPTIIIITGPPFLIIERYSMTLSLLFSGFVFQLFQFQNSFINEFRLHELQVGQFLERGDCRSFVSRRPRGPAGGGGLYNERKSA